MYQVLSPDFKGEIPDSIKDDLREFSSRMETEEIDFKSLGLDAMNLESVLADIRRIYGLD